MLQSKGCTVAAVVVSADREEKGTGSDLSAVLQVEKDLGIKASAARNGRKRQLQSLCVPTWVYFSNIHRQSNGWKSKDARLVYQYWVLKYHFVIILTFGIAI